MHVDVLSCISSLSFCYLTCIYSVILYVLILTCLLHRRRQMYRGHQPEFESGEVGDNSLEQGEIVSDEEIAAKRLRMPRHHRPPSPENGV